MTIYEEVRQQLSARRGSWPQVARDAEVGYQWLIKMMAGKFDDPGVKKIERLHAVLGLGDRDVQEKKEAA